jgi:hypothetical protein
MKFENKLTIGRAHAACQYGDHGSTAEERFQCTIRDSLSGHHTVDLMEEGTIYRIRGTVYDATQGMSGFYFWTDTTASRKCVYFWAARSWGTYNVVQNTYNPPSWGVEEMVLFAASRIVTGQPFTFYLLVTATTVTWTFEDFTTIYTFKNRMVGTKGYVLEPIGAMTVERLKRPVNVSPFVLPANRGLVLYVHLQSRCLKNILVMESKLELFFPATKK